MNKEFKPGDVVRLVGGMDEWEFVRYMPQSRDFNAGERVELRMNNEVGPIEFSASVVELIRRRMNDKEKVAFTINTLQDILKPGSTGIMNKLVHLKQMISE